MIGGGLELVFLILTAVLAVALLLGLSIILVRAFVELLTGSSIALSLPPAAIRAVVEQLDLQPGDVLIDLGCGSGRLLEAAAKAQPKAKFIGIDHDPTLVLATSRRLKRLGANAEVRRQDLFSADLSEVTKVYCYLSDDALAKLEPKLDRELSPGAGLICLDYRLPKRKPSQTIQLDKSARRGRVVYVYNY